MQKPVYKMQNRQVCTLIIIIIVSIFCLNCINRKMKEHFNEDLLFELKDEEIFSTRKHAPSIHNIWIMFVRLSRNNTRTTIENFQRIVENIAKMSSVPICFHFIIDTTSKTKVENEMKIREIQHYKLYDLDDCKEKIRDISDALMPHLSVSDPYFQDSMFYISLGLHRIAPQSQLRAAMLDCDLIFRKDVRLLFEEFKKFKPGALFGIGPELSPLYHNYSDEYRRIHPNTTFGVYYHPDKILSESQPHPRGYQGYNSGVVLFDFKEIRRSERYKKLFDERQIDDLFEKYQFRGHLGDQDFFSVIGYEWPDLIQTLNCGFNRQLCKVMQADAYKDAFEDYFKCDHPVVILHGNCKTRIPDELS